MDPAGSPKAVLGGGARTRVARGFDPLNGHMRIVAIDPSLTDTGVCNLNVTGPPLIWGIDRVRSKAAPGYPGTLARIELMVAEIKGLIWPTPPDLVVFERPALSRSQGMAHDRAGLWWLIYQMLDDLTELDRVMIPEPNLRAKYVTGRGNAAKDEVMAGVIRRYGPLGALVSNNNEADAVAMAAMGARLLGAPIESSLPAKNIDALRTLTPFMKGRPNT